MSPDSFIAELVRKLYREEIAARGKLRGLAPEDVAELERRLARPLPTCYRQLLLVMGRDAGEFFIGSDIFGKTIDGLLDLQRAALDLITENGNRVRLPDAAFVFLMHQGYTFAYFRLDDGDDPPVFVYLEPDEHTRAADHFSAFILAEADYHSPSA
jgi:hypothetical protein